MEFQSNLFNAKGWLVRPKHVARIDETNKTWLTVTRMSILIWCTTTWRSLPKKKYNTVLSTWSAYSTYNSLAKQHDKIFCSKAKHILFEQNTIMHPDTKHCAVGSYSLWVLKLLTISHLKMRSSCCVIKGHLYYKACDVCFKKVGWEMTNTDAPIVQSSNTRTLILWIPFPLRLWIYVRKTWLVPSCVHGKFETGMF